VRQINNFETILEKLEFYTTKIENIFANLKSQEQLKIVAEYYRKLNLLIPKPLIIKDKQKIKKVMDIKFSACEKKFITFGKFYGLDFLNILMYIHGVSQGNLATAQRVKFGTSMSAENLTEETRIQHRMFIRLLDKFDFYLLSSIEFLLKKCIPDILEKKRNLRINYNEYLEIFRQFIEDFVDYLTNKRQLLHLNLNLYDFSLVIGPGFNTYFRVAFKSKEIIDMAEKGTELYLDYEITYDKPDFNAFLQHFSHVKDIWLDKMGYQMKNFVSTIKLLGDLILNKYQPFFTLTLIELPEKLLFSEAKKLFYEYIKNIIKFYLENSELEDTFINLRDFRKLITSNITDINNYETAKIIRELCVDPSEPYISLFNTMANRFLYPVDNERAFLYINNVFNALNERFYFDLAKIDDNSKENVFLTPIIQILMEHGFKIHPLSGHQMIDNKKKTIGEIDIIATKDEYLLYIESKIMSQKSISPYDYDSFGDKLRKMEKKFKKFDKNISNFNIYCQNPKLLDHFLDYKASEILDVSRFSEKKYFFITPYLTYQPIFFKTKHRIELINLSLLDSRIRKLV